MHGPEGLVRHNADGTFRHFKDNVVVSVGDVKPLGEGVETKARDASKPCV